MNGVGRSGMGWTDLDFKTLANIPIICAGPNMETDCLDSSTLLHVSDLSHAAEEILGFVATQLHLSLSTSNTPR